MYQYLKTHLSNQCNFWFHSTFLLLLLGWKLLLAQTIVCGCLNGFSWSSFPCTPWPSDFWNKSWSYPKIYLEPEDQKQDRFPCIQSQLYPRIFFTTKWKLLGDYIMLTKCQRNGTGAAKIRFLKLDYDFPKRASWPTLETGHNILQLSGSLTAWLKMWA